MRSNEDAAVPVVRHFVRRVYVIFWAGLAVHPFGRHQTHKIRVGLLYWYHMFGGGQIYAQWTEDATAPHGRVAQAALLACFGGVDAAYFIRVLRARKLFPGRGGVGVAGVCITVLPVRRHAGRDSWREVSGEGDREDL